MKIAVTYENGEIFQHFGHTAQFKVYNVEDGKIVRPINLITVAGNFLDMMKEVEAVGSDLEDALSSASAPSILFNSLSISGE